jgi:hypothetical protein
MTNDSQQPVLRVTQLDTVELDDALLLNLKKSINEDFFKYIQSKTLQKYNVEIFTGLKMIIWYYTYGKRNQTIGQSILGWQYVPKSLKK